MALRYTDQEEDRVNKTSARIWTVRLGAMKYTGVLCSFFIFVKQGVQDLQIYQ